MATSLTANFVTNFNWNYQNPVDLETGISAGSKNYTKAMSAGTGASAVNLIWSDQGTIASGGSASIDLAGALTNVLGVTAVFTKVKGILLINRGVAAGSGVYTATSGENILVATSTVTWLASAVQPIEPNGVLCLTSPIVGLPITATTADTITLTRAGSSTVTYEIVVVGLS